MSLMDLSPYAEDVMKQLGQPVTITNITEDDTNRDDYGDPSESEDDVNVANAIVDVHSADTERAPSGFEHRYDASVYVPKGTSVFEADDSHRASEVTVDNTGVVYKVEKKDIQNGLIRLDCRRKRN